VNGLLLLEAADRFRATSKAAFPCVARLAAGEDPTRLLFALAPCPIRSAGSFSIVCEFFARGKGGS